MDPQLQNKESAPDDGVHRLRQDHPCVGCGYNLRTLPHAGICPECGRPVSDSTRKGVLVAPREVLLTIRMGAKVLAVLPLLAIGGMGLTVFLFALSKIFLRSSFHLHGPFWGILVAAMLVHGFVIFGSHQVGTPVPGQPEWPTAPRILTRYGAVTLLLGPMVFLIESNRHVDFAIQYMMASYSLWMTASVWLVRSFAKLADDELLRSFATAILSIGFAGSFIYLFGIACDGFGVLGDVWYVVALYKLNNILIPFLICAGMILSALLMNGLVQLLNKSLEGDD